LLIDLLVPFVQAGYATGLPELSEGHGTHRVYAKENFVQQLRKGKMHHFAIACARSVQATSTDVRSGWNLVCSNSPINLLSAGLPFLRNVLPAALWNYSLLATTAHTERSPKHGAVRST